MSNKTATEAPFYDLGLGVPLWVVIVWVAAGVILVAMVVLILYACRTRKSVPGNKRDTEEEELDEHERQRSITLIDTYPQGCIEELHTIKHISSSKHLFPPTFVKNMRIPRATEVKMVASENGAVADHLHHHHTAAENSGLTLDELTISISNYDYGNVDEDDFTELHQTNRKINISREASFRTSNISEENKARQLLREKMLVNELREKIRRDRRTVDEDSI